MEKLASAMLVARKKDFQEFCQWKRQLQSVVLKA
jgi:hypothetical protein